MHQDLNKKVSLDILTTTSQFWAVLFPPLFLVHTGLSYVLNLMTYFRLCYRRSRKWIIPLACIGTRCWVLNCWLLWLICKHIMVWGNLELAEENEATHFQRGFLMYGHRIRIISIHPFRRSSLTGNLSRAKQTFRSGRHRGEFTGQRQPTYSGGLSLGEKQP